MERLSRIITLCLFAPVAYAQSGEQTDPLEGATPFTVESKDIFLLWSEGPTQNAMLSYQKVYKYNSDGLSLPLDERLSAIPRHVDSALVTGNQQMDVASGQFNVGPYDDVVAGGKEKTSRSKC